MAVKNNVGVPGIPPGTDPQIVAALKPIYLALNNISNALQQVLDERQAETSGKLAGTYTSLQANSGFGCNGKLAQSKYSSGGTVVTTAPTLASYGYTQAQAADIITKLNNVITALTNCGIMG